MKKGIFTILALLLGGLFLAGCTTTPAIQAPGAAFPGTDIKFYDFGTFTNNSTGTALGLGSILDSHAFNYAYGGNWTSALANVSLQGSLDAVTWTELTSAVGSSNNTSFATSKPVAYVRVSISGWNATAGNASVANLTVKYAGRG